MLTHLSHQFKEVKISLQKDNRKLIQVFRKPSSLKFLEAKLTIAIKLKMHPAFDTPIPLLEIHFIVTLNTCRCTLRRLVFIVTHRRIFVIANDGKLSKCSFSMNSLNTLCSNYMLGYYPTDILMSLYGKITIIL